MVDAHNASRVVLDEVAVTADAMAGKLDRGGEALTSTLDAGRAVLASELLGMADEAFECTLACLKERRQFDRIIGEFKALHHRIAHLYSEIEITRALAIHSQQLLDQGSEEACAVVSVAKARTGMTSSLAMQEAVQMHGGMGMTDEFEIGFFMKQQRVAQELLRDACFHVNRWARLRE